MGHRGPKREDCLLKTADLRPYERNARRHSPAQIEQICALIRECGWTSPVIVDESRQILAGHGRVEAARRLGLAKVPCVVVRGLTPDQKRAYVLADNKIPENASWDRELLAAELAELKGTAELDLTGFSFLELSAALDPKADIEEAPDEPEKPRAKRGDLYELGKHRLLCGDASDSADVRRVASKGWDCAVLDPLFEMDKLSHVTDPCVVFYSSIKDVAQIPREMIRFERVIDKRRGHRIASTHVSCQHAYVVQVGTEKTCPRDRKTYPSIVVFDERPNHPHQKPVWLVVEHLTAWMKPWARVFDPYAGSGTTIMAAEQLGRQCLALEIDPARVDVIVTRWERYTGKVAKRVKS